MKKLGFLSIFFLACCSCGSLRTTVRVVNKSDGSETTISIKQGDGGSTSVNVVPTVNTSVDSVSFNFANPDRGKILP